MGIFGSILLINFIVIIYVMSGIDVLIRKKIWERLYGKMPFNENWMSKPWGCEWCLGTWIGLISLFWLGFTQINIFLVLVIAFYNFIIKDYMILIKDMITKLIDIVYKYLD